VLPYPHDRTFSEAISRDEGPAPSRPVDLRVVREILGEIRSVDFGPNSVPDWMSRQKGR
jgi:hypothetical protein